MKSTVWIVLLGGVLWASGTARAGDAASAARNVAAKAAPAVVHLKVVVSTKVTVQGRELPARERESEILGTVLDGSGLIVTSNASADPGSAQAAMSGGRYKVESQIKSTRLLRKDGTEIPLKVVLRDKDLDLMFLRPEKKAALPHLGLARQAGPKLGLMDPAIILSRLGPVGDRQPAVAVSRVEAVVTKPRTLYVLGTLDSMSAVGCPVFDLNGQLVGLLTVRVTRASGGGLFGGLRTRMLPVVLPVADLLDDIKQTEEE